MSRVGKKPIPLPEGVTVAVSKGRVTVKGGLGTLERDIDPKVPVEVDKDEVRVLPWAENKKARAFQGLYRSLISNMVVGVSQGYTRVLEINGVGYRAQVQGSQLTLNIGYSNPVVFDLPKGIEAEVEPKKNLITLKGIDKELLGTVAANIRGVRPCDPYKAKGIKYLEEVIRRKAGKAGVTGAV